MPSHNLSLCAKMKVYILKNTAINFFSIFLLSLISTSLFSQENEFTLINTISHTPVKNQAISGTCWSFATSSFIESEVKRISNLDIDLSEMFTVRHIYKEKIITHARMQGYNFLTEGGQSHNVFFVLKHFGAVPESVYSGLESGKIMHNQIQLAAAVESMMSDTLKKYTKGIVPNLYSETDSILSLYLGNLPEDFIYNSKKYTPENFKKEVLKINTGDYIELTSYSHNPYYKGFILKDKFNWAMNTYYNLPLEEFMQVVDNALSSGFSVCWNGDVSEKGFDFYRGMAEITDNNIETNAKGRQELYDNQKTTVDHLMHIVGTAKNSKGEEYFYVKNSWGKDNLRKGYLFMSRDYFILKTVSVCVHKDAIPKEILPKIKLVQN